MKELNQSFFKESFANSLGNLFKEFYHISEIELLEKELSDYFLSSKENELTITAFSPDKNDALLRLNLTCLIIIGPALPFFPSRLKKILEQFGLDVNRSLHFHPNEKEELFYIEVRDIHPEGKDSLFKEIHSSYQNIEKYTSDYASLIDNKDIFESWEDKIKELLDWLVRKSLIIEGAIYINEENGQAANFGSLGENSQELEWLKSLSIEASTEIYAKETLESSYMDEGQLVNIAFTGNSKRLLLKGIFNQHANNTSIREIPIIRDKFQNFTDKEKINPLSGIGRRLRLIFNTIPTELLFILPESSYRPIYSSIMEESMKSSTRSSGVLIDSGTCLLISFIPEANWEEEKIKTANTIIKDTLENCSIKFYQKLLNQNSILLFQLVRSTNINKHKLFEISSGIEILFMSWNDLLRNKWEDRFKTEPFPEELVFRKDYIATHSPDKAISDIDSTRKLKNDRVILNISSFENEVTILSAITQDKEYSLSLWVNALNQFSLSPISQRVYRFTYNNVLYAKSEFFFEYIKDHNNLYSRLEEALTLTMKGLLPSDPLSACLLNSNLNSNGLFFIKSMREYALQTDPYFNSNDFNEILNNHPEFCDALWEYFENKFNHGKIKNEDFLTTLSDRAKSIKEDEVLNTIRTCVLAILRTDFFGTKNEKESGKYKTGVTRGAVAYKIDSSVPISLPSPRPFKEIFTYSADFQGIHLRGGNVARGGIRFSDRPSDYRTEILSLMKTQMVKNALIVPVGSKGGFVLSKNVYAKKQIPMVEAYRKYISLLLNLTDNYHNGQVEKFVGEQGPYAYDDVDPYLVVAADKGTAQLSDTANEISIEYKFWLGDAFASGGSRGYSHKALGITAKGALVTADRHLRNLGIDFRKEPVTLIGIGDMGGDVFGNGLLESKYFKLLAAFNHKHIFLDPDPDPFTSYEERKRLFNSKDSGWNFYNQSIISKGGGVFERTEKSIPITPQVKKALGISEEFLSGSELIIALLKAPVDLFYNGGIGTYVKASSEDNSKVGDPANNDVRINGGDIRAKVVSEGGNLGFTQNARIEYSFTGGRIYTDALDNSAGVDLSDHEVNLKIFFTQLIGNQIIPSLEMRDQILQKLSLDVASSVLSDNSLQSLAIECDSYESSESSWDNYIDAANFLIDKKILDPVTEKIPSSLMEWNEIKKKSNAIPNPILCVLLGYSKMYLYGISLKSGLFKSEDYPEIYFSYFPASIREKYASELKNHLLRNEILNTLLVNIFINLMGITGLLLLGFDNNQTTRFKKIADDIYNTGVYGMLNEIALLRDKKVEKELPGFLSNLREKFRKKWSLNGGNDLLDGNSISLILSKKSKSIIKKL